MSSMAPSPSAACSPAARPRLPVAMQSGSSASSSVGYGRQRMQATNLPQPSLLHPAGCAPSGRGNAHVQRWRPAAAQAFAAPRKRSFGKQGRRTLSITASGPAGGMATGSGGGGDPVSVLQVQVSAGASILCAHSKSACHCG